MHVLFFAISCQMGLSLGSRTTADINSLPDFPLALIIQHLPWRDRVQVERVSQRWRSLCLSSGWARVKKVSCRLNSSYPNVEEWFSLGVSDGLDDNEHSHGCVNPSVASRRANTIRPKCMSPEQTEFQGSCMEVLRRCGVHVSSLHLYNFNSITTAAMLECCPNVSDVRICGWGIGREADCLHGSRKLSSFTYHLLGSSHYSPRLHPNRHHMKSEILASINQLLAECESLVSFGLVTRGVDGLFLIQLLQLPARLRVLSLRHDDLMRGELSGELLTEEKVAILAENLQSLTLHECSPPLSHTQLARFTHLTHLNIQLSAANVASFISTLSSLPLLRALELDSYLRRHESALPVGDWGEAILALAVNCPELEHLGMSHYSNLTAKAISPGLNSLTRLEKLVSIEWNGTGDWRGQWKRLWSWMAGGFGGEGTVGACRCTRAAHVGGVGVRARREVPGTHGSCITGVTTDCFRSCATSTAVITHIHTRDGHAGHTPTGRKS